MDSAAVSRSRGGGGEWRKWAVGGGWVISARERFGDVAHGSRVGSWSPRGGGALLRCPCPLAAVRYARLPDGMGWAGLGWALAPGTRVSPQSRRSTSLLAGQDAEGRTPGVRMYKQTENGDDVHFVERKGHVDVHAK
jgi:hypothetical protein